MSLQVWLPFNGNIENKGLYTNLTYSGNCTFSDNGKISNKTKNGGLSITAKDNPMSLNGTICFWIYVDSNTDVSTNNIIFGNISTDAGTGNRKWSLFLFPDRNTIHTWGCMDDTKSDFNGNGSFTEKIIPDNEWTHIAVSHDDKGNQYLYKNGSLYKSYKYNTNGTFTFKNVNTPICYSNTGILFNDLRIYDNCLSDKEIREVYKCLCLHYDCRQIGDAYGSPNLLMDSNYSISQSGSGTKTSQQFYFVKDTTSLEAGDYYSLRGKEITISLDFNISNVLSAQSKRRAGYEIQFLTDSGKSTYLGIWFDFNNTTATTFKGRKYYTGIIPSDWNGKYSESCMYIQGVDSGNVTIAKPKIELGKNINSIWSPYYAFNYNKISSANDVPIDYIPDNSGYSKYGIAVQYPIVIKDSTIGDYSIDFTGDLWQGIYCDNSPLSSNSDFTINFWCKFINIVDTQCLLCCRTSVGNGYAIFLVDDKFRFDANDSQDTFDFIPKLNTWYMFTFVKNKNNKSLYVNGELNQTTTTTSNITNYVNNYCTIGWSYSSINKSWDDPTNVDDILMGYLNDYRIYNTVLNDKDILFLYNKKASIDNKGNIYTNEFIEGSENNLLSIDQYPTNPTFQGSFVGTFTLVDCKDSKTNKATKITCTTAGQGFYIQNYNVFNKTGVALQNGKKYIWSMYVKSDNRTNINFNVECASSQSATSFTINNVYRKIYSIFTYSSSTRYYAFTCYSNFKVNDNLYMHSFEVKEYNPNIQFKENSSINGGNFKEVNEAEQKARIYPQDIQANNIIEI